MTINIHFLEGASLLQIFTIIIMWPIFYTIIIIYQTWIFLLDLNSFRLFYRPGIGFDETLLPINQGCLSNISAVNLLVGSVTRSPLQRSLAKYSLKKNLTFRGYGIPKWRWKRECSRLNEQKQFIIIVIVERWKAT